MYFCCTNLKLWPKRCLQGRVIKQILLKSLEIIFQISLDLADQVEYWD